MRLFCPRSASILPLPSLPLTPPHSFRYPHTHIQSLKHLIHQLRAREQRQLVYIADLRAVASRGESHNLQHSLQHNATHCNALQRTATHPAARCNTQQRQLVYIADLRAVASRGESHTLQHALQHLAAHCNTQQRQLVYVADLHAVASRGESHNLQHALECTATPCSALQHTATPTCLHC